jgi:hypothetical protein
VGPVTTDYDWQRWCERFDRTHNGIVRLFHDRAIWRTILAMLDDNPAVTRGGHGEYWLGWCYTTTQLIGIRRETDDDRDGTGLGRSLKALASNPRMATRVWYEQQIRAAGYGGAEFRELAGIFGRFAQAGAAFVDSALVRQDIDALRAIVADVNAFTTKVLAHRDDRVGRSAPSLPPMTLADLDAAIDAVGTIDQKYYSLRYPGEALGSLTPLKTREWTRLFDAAWMPPGFEVPPATSTSTRHLDDRETDPRGDPMPHGHERSRARRHRRSRLSDGGTTCSSTCSGSAGICARPSSLARKTGCGKAPVPAACSHEPAMRAAEPRADGTAGCVVRAVQRHRPMARLAVRGIGP